ncbi:MAG: hypothetical protein IH962_00575 [Chloroflexi bacterium]|nr:hypothetical protein [Chloroflexota bacterium]
MEFLAIPAAAQRLGVSIDTVRRRLRKGELPGQHQPTPQGFIWMVKAPSAANGAPAEEHLLPDFKHIDAECGTRVVTTRGEAPIESKSLTANLPALRELVEVLRHEIDTMDRQLGIKDGRLESKDRQIGQLHSLLQQAHAGPPGPMRPEDLSLIAPADIGN